MSNITYEKMLKTFNDASMGSKEYAYSHKKEREDEALSCTIGFIISQINIISRERGNRILQKILKNYTFTL